MKKIIMAIALCLVCASCFGQFICKTIDNGFDEPFKKAICYSTPDSPDKGSLCFEEKFAHPYTYITGSYFCDDVLLIDVSFDNGNKYLLSGEKGKKSNFVHIVPYCTRFNMETEECHKEWEEFWNDMKTCSVVKFRINESHCENNVYFFNLKGSSKAIDFTSVKE